MTILNFQNFEVIPLQHFLGPLLQVLDFVLEGDFDRHF